MDLLLSQTLVDEFQVRREDDSPPARARRSRRVCVATVLLGVLGSLPRSIKIPRCLVIGGHELILGTGLMPRRPGPDTQPRAFHCVSRVVRS